MMQNLGSNPNRSCNTITEIVMMMGFLYLMNCVFMIGSNQNLAYTTNPK